jgi:L-serine dehydratase
VYLNISQCYRVGPGPSSSQTVAPLEAARRFVHELAADGLVTRTARVRVELFGALACTGRELGAQRAVVAGLAGIPTASCDGVLLARCTADAESDRSIALAGRHRIDFRPERDVVFRVDAVPAHDGSALGFSALDPAGEVLFARSYHSLGDGGVASPEDPAGRRGPASVPYAYSTTGELLEVGRTQRMRIAEITLANESVVHSPGEVRSLLLRIADTMRGSIERGLATDGTLPGGRVRRAPALADTLRAGNATAAQWCAVFATAVAEENAAGGRVVAAPSNGSAGPVAALLSHFRETPAADREPGTVDFLLTAAAIGGLLRMAGLVRAGCQSEVGVAAAMAAAGFASAQRGSNDHVLMAAALALEPHLGLACDPEGARIQQPCIERNAAAADRAVTAAQTALGESMPRQSLDALTTAMIERGHRMAERYKQASPGGIAVNVADC